MNFRHVIQQRITKGKFNSRIFFSLLEHTQVLYLVNSKKNSRRKSDLERLLFVGMKTKFETVRIYYLAW